MYSYEHKFNIIAIKGSPVDQSSCSSFSELIGKYKYQNQIREWLEARTDQDTARKAWSDYIVICYINKLNLTCDRKLLLYIDINSTCLNYKTKK